MWNSGRMLESDRMLENDEKDKYLVRVTSLAGVTGSFIWEVCRGDGLLGKV